VKTRNSVLRRGRALSAGTLLACFLTGLLGGPAAQAAFTGSVSAAMPVSTLVLPAPAGNLVTATCYPLRQKNEHWLRIAVNRHGTVPRATGYVLKIYNPRGAVEAIIDLSPEGTYQGFSANAGWWSYSIEAQYRVAPGSQNMWTSSAPRQSLHC
jgi:hypothetical protein